VTVPTVEPVPAATVVLTRPGRDGLEVLLTRRPATMAFAPNVHVFPGGRVDPEDSDPALLARSVVAPAAAAQALGGDLEPVAALAAHVAAIRELFEEAGVLLADAVAGAGAAAPSRVASAARSSLVGGEASFGSIATELELTLRTDLLVPLSRWVTPPFMPRRFDARFFAASLPAGARVSFEGDEIAGHAWLTPAAALAAMARGEIELWPPTSATLQQLEHATSLAEMRERLSPGPLGAVEVEAIGPALTRIVMPAGGGVAGQPVCAYLVGRRRHVLVDPGDPTGPGLTQAIELVAARGGSIEAVTLTQVDPDHAAGAEWLAELLGIPVLAGIGAGRALPYPVAELADLERIDRSDVALRAVHAPGPSPAHLALVVEEGETAAVIAGDLDGRRGARAILAPADDAVTSASRDRLRGLAPDARWLAGHPGPIDRC
jgi:glyoxylase-like metal-dependent hydrolase (beta-lactamase superfamily II)/8-oxo-dGTP pyrophosphatase MutT (NUDIX family)